MNTRTLLLTVALMLLAVFATAFALINYNQAVKVWPLMTFQPLTLVIGVSFLLGAGVGVLFISLMHHRRVDGAVRSTPDTLPTATQERQHTGRP